MEAHVYWEIIFWAKQMGHINQKEKAHFTNLGFIFVSHLKKYQFRNVNLVWIFNIIVCNMDACLLEICRARSSYLSFYQIVASSIKLGGILPLRKQCYMPGFWTQPDSTLSAWCIAIFPPVVLKTIKLPENTMFCKTTRHLLLVCLSCLKYLLCLPKKVLWDWQLHGQ